MKKILLFASLIVNMTFTEAQIVLPYPIIFIHGLNNNSGTWNEFASSLQEEYRFKFGGRLNFCLNSDNDKTFAYFDSDYTDFTAINNGSNLEIADYYTVNFDVTPQGYPFDSPSYQDYGSNQSAIYKQGRAIRDAIKHVLNITKRDKVILVGHSMGGLASREYLANPEIWQSDGKHHVAKLYTTATPHGGSNTSDPTGGLINLFSGIDERSEAVRDLKSYYANGYAGVYLFGGAENFVNILYSYSSNYRNVDVNCDYNIADTIVGLTSKYSPSDVYYSCAVGVGKSLLTGGLDVNGNTDNTGDGIVGAKRADMNNYMYLQPPLQFFADTFVTHVNSLVEFHGNMSEYFDLNMKGLDEPDNFNLAYDIDTGKTYLGFTTRPSQASLVSKGFDYDVYKFRLPKTNSVKVSIINPTNNMAVFIYDKSFTTQHFFGVSTLMIDTTLTLPDSGTYYLTIVTLQLQANTPWYAFGVTETQNTVTAIEEVKLEEIKNAPLVSVFPNPAQNTVNVTANGDNSLRITSVQGHNILTQQFNNNTTIDVNNFAKGLYIFEIYNNETVQRRTVILQ